MPGSPATNTILPKTIPPPKTRFSSASVVMILSSSALFTLCNAIDLPRCAASSFQDAQSSFSFLSVPLTSTSSTNVFQLLQFGHLPNHLALSYPQAWQKKADLVLLMF